MCPRLFLPLALWATCLPLGAQHPLVQALLDSVRIDSMLLYVNELSGEVPVNVGNGPQTIVSRHKYAAGNVIAQSYLEERLAQWGYTPVLQNFSTTGRNIMAIKPGTLHPDEFVILCAHFDAMPGGIAAAPAADDDGSGCAAVLEAARILRHFQFEHSIVLAFWDEEEQGLVGSAFYAAGMAANDALIKGVVNMDAIAWDGNGDTKARVHTRPIANSLAIADTAFLVRAQYGIALDLLLTNPGATYSDHASFWNNAYGAILIIEEFGADGNPYYHTPNDKVQYFDVPYYEKLAKLSIGTMAHLAVPSSGPQAMATPRAHPAATLYAHPNPAQAEAQLWLEVPGTARYRVALCDAMGREVALLHNGPLAAGKHRFTLPFAGLAPGNYLALARPDDGPPLTLTLVRLP